MKKNSPVQIYSRSKISSSLERVKRAVSFVTTTRVFAALLVLMLTVTIMPAKGSVDVNEGRWLEDFDLNLEHSQGPGCSFEPAVPTAEMTWQWVLAGEQPPPGGATAITLLQLIGELPADRPESLNSVDPQIGSLRLLTGSIIGLHNDSGEAVAAVSTSRADTKTLYRMYNGSYFDDTRPFKVDVGYTDYIAKNPPTSYIALQQPLFGEIGWKDDSQQLFASYGKYWLSNRLNLGNFGLYLKPDAFSSGGNGAAMEAEGETFQVNEAFLRQTINWKFGGGMTSVDPPQLDLSEDPDDQSPAFGERVRLNFDTSFTGSDRLRTRLAFEEDNAKRKVQAADVAAPNDPLYSKTESGASKAVSTVQKGIGSLLKLGKSTGFSIGTGSDDTPKPPGQWGMHKVGYTPLSDPGSAWKIEDGRRKNVVVAVIDSGLDLTHVDRPAYLWTNAGEIADNQKDDDGNGYVDDINGWNFIGENNDIMDYYGHGTFVAGIIAAKTNNGEGIAGINPGAQIMTLKVTDKEGRARSLSIYRAIRYAVDNGARVINISLGEKGISHLEQVGVNYAYAQGCIVVIAAGNQAGNVAEYGPPGVRRAFSVAAVNVDGKRRTSANSGFNVAMTAPGEHIHSLTAQQGKKDGVITPMMPTTYHPLSGTSFSAPFVAGTASLIWAKYPHLTNRQVEDMLFNSAVDLDAKGWDPYHGAGLLNASAAIASPPDDIAVRFTQVFTNKKRDKIVSVDVYGVVRGNLNSYAVEVGKGKKPSSWKQVCGPFDQPAEFNLICRIDKEMLASGRDSTVRIKAQSRNGQTRTASFLVRKY